MVTSTQIKLECRIVNLRLQSFLKYSPYPQNVTTENSVFIFVFWSIYGIVLNQTDKGP